MRHGYNLWKEKASFWDESKRSGCPRVDSLYKKIRKSLKKEKLSVWYSSIDGISRFKLIWGKIYRKITFIDFTNRSCNESFFRVALLIGAMIMRNSLSTKTGFDIKKGQVFACIIPRSSNTESKGHYGFIWTTTIL